MTHPPADPKSRRAPRAPAEQLDLAAIAADLRAKHRLEFVGVSGRSRPRFLSALRREFTLRAVAQGHSQAAVARFLGVDPSSVARLAQS